MLLNRLLQTQRLKTTQYCYFTVLGLNVQNESYMVNIKLTALKFLSGGPEEESVVLPCSASRGYLHSVAHGPVSVSSKPST